MLTLASCISFDALKRALQKVAANKGAPGVDGVTVEHFMARGDSLLYQLSEELSKGSWQPQPLRSVEIDKSNGKKRRLAIPTVRDRVVHTALAQGIIPLWEQEFERCSYGYRPGLSYIDAIKRVEYLRDRDYLYVLDADLKGYFDHIPHQELAERVKSYLPDSELAGLVIKAVTSHQFYENTLCFGSRAGFGIPQGSALSPLLSNLYLDCSGIVNLAT